MRKHILTDEQIRHTSDWLRERFIIAQDIERPADIAYYDGAMLALAKMGFSILGNFEIVINDIDEEVK